MTALQLKKGYWKMLRLGEKPEALIPSKGCMPWVYL